MKEAVLKHFEELSGIPRPSGHEERAAAFIHGWAESHGFAVRTDEYKNVIAEIPAIPGYENAPRTILQAHMDMVCVAEPGRKFDPLTDTPTLVYENADGREILTADGTSLGGDDGLGIATMMAVAENPEIVHGPLRLIATANEENGMSGAEHLTAADLDARYLINLDSEEFGELTNSSAGSQNLTFRRKAEWVDAPWLYGYTIRFSGFRGGHSGCDIHKNRCNVLKLMGETLMNVPHALHTLKGGTARNAIPDEVCVKLVTDEPELLWDAMHDTAERLSQFDEPNTCSISMTPAAGLTRTLTPQASVDTMRLLAGIPCGVLKMSDSFEGLVETSCSIGIAELNAEEITVTAMARSSATDGLPRTEEKAHIRALAHNFRLEAGSRGAIWPVMKDDPLVRLFRDAYREVTGGELRVAPIHAGLETATYAMKNPELSLVAVGATVHSVHSIREYVELNTVEPFGQVLARVLEKIASEQ